MKKPFYYKTTYSKLDKALMKLNFIKKDYIRKNGISRIYVNSKYDSIIAIPKLHGNKLVSDIHISSTFTNLYYKDIIKTEKIFIKLLV